MLPIRQISSNHATTPLPEARASQPSVVPPARPSTIPANAIGSIMPGASMHMHSALLSGVAGYVDAAGFASLVGLFPAHLTGEIVGDAIAMSSGHASSHATRFWMVPVFVASVTTATLAARLLRRSGRRALTGLLALVTGGLALFAASDVLARSLHENGPLHLMLGGACAVAAMGFQNALMRESMSGSCPTTVMTGNLTHVVIEIVDHLFSKLSPPHKRDRRPRSRLLPVVVALLAFAACAVLGGFLTRVWGSLSVLLPTALVGTLTFRAWREDRRLAEASKGAGSMLNAPLPTFDVWPNSLLPRVAHEQPSPSMPPKVPLPEGDRERPLMKRTISGTQLSSRLFRKDE